ncbi:MAG TPA: molybdopterin-guanine dinucleotide biosynthesis protein B [Candidatus Ozemobacteraceae bacterium]|nr:molybdopterin-guanine dinucleotide biosynthesis protein B [Candidatus Ozemobacteraceae bacterium]
MRIIRVLGKSGSGKTTLIDALVKRLSHLRIAVIKHTRHPLDPPASGKDTACHLAAGAVVSAGISPGRAELFVQGAEIGIDAMIAFVADRVDLVFIEGAREYDAPTVLLGDLPEYSIANNIILRLPVRPDVLPDLSQHLPPPSRP